MKNIQKEKKIKLLNTKRIKIKKKGVLKTLLRNEGYDKIAIWADGTWVNMQTGYTLERDGDNPVAYINRTMWYDLLWKEINGLVTKKESEINR